MPPIPRECVCKGSPHFTASRRNSVNAAPCQKTLENASEIRDSEVFDSVRAMHNGLSLDACVRVCAALCVCPQIRRVLESWRSPTAGAPPGPEAPVLPPQAGAPKCALTMPASAAWLGCF